LAHALAKLDERKGGISIENPGQGHRIREYGQQYKSREWETMKPPVRPQTHKSHCPSGVTSTPCERQLRQGISGKVQAGQLNAAGDGWPPFAALFRQPGLNTRFAAAGAAINLAAGRTGRAISPPPQFGQTPCRISAAQVSQNVHSNEQIIAPSASAGKSLSQHSHPGRMSSISASHLTGGDY